MPIAVKIDVTKIQKERLFPGKNGAKYLDVILFESRNDKYGNDYMVCQAVSKEERQQGVRGPILGNGKNLALTVAPARNREIPDHQKYNTTQEDLEDLPF